MAEYTYKDIIIDPTSEEAENAVGKEVYFADTPARCLNAAKNNNKAYLGYLKKLDLGDEEQPFYVNEFVVSAPSSWTCIIVKKEEPKPKYVSFESKEEFIEAFHYHDNVNYSETEDILLNYGMWLWDKNDEAYKMISEIWNGGVIIGDMKVWTALANQASPTFNNIKTWKKLTEEYEFLDGSPCGRLVEEKHE